jgi:glycosyltransferase involved in cell wall biosynthesis
MRAAREESPRVSVLMPVYNGERWLAEAVRSVLDQSLPSLELLAVDDGSSDGSPAALSEFSARDPRVRVIRRPHAGLAATLNAGLAEARAPYVARLDCDDLAHSERLERQAAWLDGRPSVGLVGAWALEIDARGRPLGLRTPPSDDASLRAQLPKLNPFVHSSIMARVALLRELGGYRAAFEGAEDYDLWLRASEATELSNIPEPLVSYRVHSQGVTARRRLRQAFSVRLAQRAAHARNQRLRDPADTLETPPDWRGAPLDGAFYADDADLYRWLDPSGDARACANLIERIGELNHAERRLAAQALLARMRSADPAESGPARGLLLKLFRQRPSTVLRAAWSLRV